MAILALGSFGAGAARNIPELLLYRIAQAFGASSGLSVGIGVLADIYKLEERGRSSGVFFGVRAIQVGYTKQTDYSLCL